MTGLLARAAALVVEPDSAADSRPAAPAGARALVLGSPSDAPPFAAALAGALRARERAPAALVCVWGSSRPPQSADSSTRPPSTSPWCGGGARRLAARLATRGLSARAAGRLVWLSFPEDAGAAVMELGRLLGRLDAPIVTALAGPRSAEHDALMSDHDLVVAVRPAASVALSEAGADALTALALAGLDGCSLACDPLPAGPARWRARVGLGRLAPAHPAVAALGPARRAGA
jgi:hypothetical protein